MMDETRDTNSDDAIAALVRLAGRRPPVPDEAAQRVRAAVHDEWALSMSRRRRTRWIGSAAAAAAVVVTAVVLRMSPSSEPAPAPRRVAVAAGQTNGAVIFANDVFEAGAGTASMAWGDATLRLDSGTRVRIASTRELSLERGAIYVDSHRSGVTIQTPIGAVRDIGTQFEVRLTADRLRVRVRQGRIDLQQGNTMHSASAGIELDSDAHGAVTQRSVPRNGPEWDWIVRAAPPIRLDGRTLADVVGVVTREEGVLPVWSDSTARAAASIRLHGDIPLTPDEALDSALIASGLTARTDGDHLVIQRRK